MSICYLNTLNKCFLLAVELYYFYFAICGANECKQEGQCDVQKTLFLPRNCQFKVQISHLNSNLPIIPSLISPLHPQIASKILHFILDFFFLIRFIVDCRRLYAKSKLGTIYNIEKCTFYNLTIYTHHFIQFIIRLAFTIVR